MQIPNAKEVLRGHLSFILSTQNKSLEWLPEYDTVSKWLENNKGRGLFLYGDCGRGKSLLARHVIPAILLEYARKVVKVYDVQDMNIKIDEALNKHIIALDDIGTEEASVKYGNKRFAFAEIMDSVEKYNKLIIITTNLRATAIRERYGDRILDRIISTTERIEFKGKSLRS